MSNPIDIIGDGIENPWNARTLIDAAQMFNSACYFRDRKGLVESFPSINSGQTLTLINCQQVAERYHPVLTLENLDNAIDLFGFKSVLDAASALVVGNERFGISYEMSMHSNHTIQIPMTGPTVNTLNVATAAAVALYYLKDGNTRRMLVRAQPQKKRPEVLLVAGDDHVELGSTIRSAAAFGWDRIFLEDRHSVWFGCDRMQRAEGRSAARRNRNAIRLVPAQKESKYAFRNVSVISTKEGVSLTKANLANGPQQLIIIPDESSIDAAAEDWHRAGAKVQFVKISVPAREYRYHYRIFASIALAEASRQVGMASTKRAARRIKQGPVYDSTLNVSSDQLGEEILFEDLLTY